VTDPRDFQPTEAVTRRSLRQGGSGGNPGGPSANPAGTAVGGTTAVERVPFTAPDGQDEKRGIAGLIARHPTAWLASALGLAFVILATSAFFIGVSVGSPASGVVPAPTESAVAPRAQPGEIPAATRLRTCSIAALAGDPRLSELTGYVVNAATGELLFDRAGAAPNRTADVLQLITASAAISVLGPDTRLVTKVVAGTTPGSIVLVGGGDATLATTPSTFYANAAQVSDLAAQVTANFASLNGPDAEITNIVLDATLWDPADRWDSTWPDSARTSGYQAQVTALMVNGDRADPSQDISPRSTDPIGNAGRALADALGLDSVSFSTGAAVGSTVLGQVQSQPVSVLVKQMLLTGDRALAETLARLVSKASGLGGTAASLNQTMTAAMSTIGLTVSGQTIKDGSGLSDANAVSPQLITQLLQKMQANESNLGIVYSGLPVAGESGDLFDRFSGPNAIAVGAVAAKPGWIESQRSLAGIITAPDGTSLAFAFFASRGGVGRDARDALDDITTAAFSCGDNLSNN
jgi:serine-type D-Ala-D-Ala carboxypeptidase/endopeptidase (penicillin-binding protein 4)